MAKKHHKPRPKRRNAAPRAPRAESSNSASAPRRSSPDDSSMRRLGYTAAGAAGTALVGTFLSHEGWAPKTIAGALAAVGAGLAWKGDGEMVRSLGAGAMSAAGSQLALMMLDDRNRKPPPPVPVARKNADQLPPGALEGALERARMRFALEAESAHEAT
jgi:hypothetical protein